MFNKNRNYKKIAKLTAAGIIGGTLIYRNRDLLKSAYDFSKQNITNTLSPNKKLQPLKY